VGESGKTASGKSVGKGWALARTQPVSKMKQASSQKQKRLYIMVIIFDNRILSILRVGFIAHPMLC
jgi:hypothetical protein